MKIVPAALWSTYRQGSIIEVSKLDIIDTLGFPPNVEEDPTEVECSWEFTVDGIPCAIWGYRGRTCFDLYSTYGPEEIFIKLFGPDHVL